MFGIKSVLAKYNGNYLFEYVKNPYLVVKNYVFWKRSKSSDKQYVFIVGAPRSGTTLLNSIVKSHSQISGFDFETQLFSYKNRFNFDAYNGNFERSEWEQLIDRSDNIVQLMDVMHEDFFSQSSWVVEKTPQHVNHIGFLIEKFPNCRVINIIRDGRDCFCSGRKAGNIPQAKEISDYARYWIKCIRSRLSLGENSDNVIDVHYEGLVENPRLEIERLMTFIGLEFEIEQLNRESVARDARSSSPEFKRLSAEINTSTVARWKEELSEAEKLNFNKLAAAELKAVGYELF